MILHEIGGPREGPLAVAADQIAEAEISQGVPEGTLLTMKDGSRYYVSESAEEIERMRLAELRT